MEELVAKYHILFEQAREKSAEWYVFGHVEVLLIVGNVDRIHKEVMKARKQCQDYANAHWFLPDTDYGTYGDYMWAKIRLYTSVLKEVALLNQPTRSTILKKQVEMPVENEDLLTVQEVARELRVDDTTVRRWIKQGVLEHIVLPHVNERQAYRIKRATLDQLLNSSTLAALD